MLEYLLPDTTGAAAPADLAGYKKWKIEQVAAKARSKISGGAFEYPAASGQYFSTADATMVNTIGFRKGQDDALWNYPVKVTFKTATGGIGQLDLQQSDNQPFFNAAANSRMALHQQAAGIIADVLAAADIAAVDAAADAYLAG